MYNQNNYSQMKNYKKSFKYLGSIKNNQTTLVINYINQKKNTFKEKFQIINMSQDKKKMMDLILNITDQKLNASLTLYNLTINLSLL